MTEADIQAAARRFEAAKNLLRGLGIAPTLENLRLSAKEIVRKARRKKAAYER